MSLSPVPNQSFLHRHRKPFVTSDRIVYATLDSLALKRARLPLQLLPVDADKLLTEKSSKLKKKRNVSNPKVDATVIPPSKPEENPSTTVEVGSDFISDKEAGKTVASSQRIDNDNRDGVIVGAPIKVADNIPANQISNYFSIVENAFSSRRGTKICPVDRTEVRYSSDDYEKIELAPRGSEIEETTEINDEGSIEGEESLLPRNVVLISESANDPTGNGYSSRPDDGTHAIEASLEGKSKTTERSLLSGEEKCALGKKKNHFAKNVLHFVPDYLVKGPKKRKKKKKKKKKKKRTSNLSSSLSSLKPAVSTDSKIGTTSLEPSYRSKSLSREELKCLKISSPTNFVHVASATNLVLNETMVGFGLEQVVITHEEKCATLPLLVARCVEDPTSENRIEQRSIATDKMPLRDASTSGKDNAKVDAANLRREFLHEFRARSAKTLERGQQVKTSENQADALEGKTRESTSSSSPSTSPLTLPHANASFLWSSQAKSLLENPRREVPRSSPNETVEDTDGQEYDDVGPLNLLNQLEDDYDDVGSPTARVDGECTGETTANDSDSIYDDVATFNYAENGRSLLFAENESGSRSAGRKQDNGEIRGDESSQEDDDHRLFGTNEYSSVDEEDDERQDGEQGVYDDVGLPSEERVNSLYAGSTTGSVFGKESEWEDLEDPTIGPPCLARKNNLSGKSTETQVVSSKKKPGQSWSRKVRRQRSRVSRKGWKSLTKPSHDSTIYVAVSLGSGSVLLVGCTGKIEKWTGEESNDGTARKHFQRTQGLVQMRVIDLDEDVDTQETSCYIYEDNASDDTTYESLRSFQPEDEEFSSDANSDSATEMIDARDRRSDTVQESKRSVPLASLEAPTRPNPPPPREASLTQTLGRRIKMLRRTWSITKESLGRMRRRTSVDDCHSCEENKESCNDHQNLDGGRYFSFTRHFKKSVTGLSTFYLNGYTANGGNDSTRTAGDDRSSKQPIYSNTVTETDHYSVLADQEPLYQFYAAAAAARGAFDSNSDGYEEVEDTIPSQSTRDFAKPGHRTLWCQTPQVISSGLLQRLSTEERRIQEAKFEILTSEASYLNSLRVLENEFLGEVSINETLTPLEKDKLFGGIPSVLQASEQFLGELETVWKQDPMLHGLPDVILRYADKCLDIYVAYCSNQVGIDTTLKDFRTRKGLKFLETVSQIEARPNCQSLSLHSFLMLPMQRITRLPLLADAVLSKLSIEHADRFHWERVLSSLSYVVAECNEGARAAAKEMEMECLARKLEYSAKIKPIALNGKHLIKSGPVVQLLTKADAEYKLTFGKKFNKTPLYLLLLTDYLLVAKYKSNGHDETYTVIDVSKRSLIALESVPEDSPFAGRNAMLLTLLENYSGRQVEYILTCESDTERQRWLEAVSPSKRGLGDETLYEVWDCPQVVALYCYSPNQPDELSLHPGDVINVLRKMSDGWFHGEKLLDGEQGWFPGNYTKEVASEHVRARNLKQRHRLLALSGSVLQRKAKQQCHLLKK